MSTIIVQSYDSRWPREFDSLRSRLASGLNGLAVSIEHVGSTAVPGLAAKPIIDIDVLLRTEADLPAAITKLAALGYVYQGDLGIHGREAFQTPANDFSHHLYVCLPECEEYRRHLVFRDYLRSHPEAVEAYGELKRGLALKFTEDRNEYTKAKSEFIAEILKRVFLATRV